MKAPSLTQAVERLAERACADGWTHEESLAACLERQAAARERGRVAHPRRPFPARKSLEEFDDNHQRSLRRDVVAHLGGWDFVAARDDGVFLGPQAPTSPSACPCCLATPGTASCSPPPPNDCARLGG